MLPEFARLHDMGAIKVKVLHVVRDGRDMASSENQKEYRNYNIWKSLWESEEMAMVHKARVGKQEAQEKERNTPDSAAVLSAVAEVRGRVDVRWDQWDVREGEHSLDGTNGMSEKGNVL
jgi:hypothetical protein